MSLPIKLISTADPSAPKRISTRSDKYNVAVLGIVMHGKIVMTDTKNEKGSRRVMQSHSIPFTEYPITPSGTLLYVNSTSAYRSIRANIDLLQKNSKINKTIFLKNVDRILEAYSTRSVSKTECAIKEGFRATDCLDCQPEATTYSIDEPYTEKEFELDRNNPIDIYKGIYLLRPFLYEIDNYETGQVDEIYIPRGTNLLTNKHFLVYAGLMRPPNRFRDMFNSITPEPLIKYNINLSQIINFFTALKATECYAVEYTCQGFDMGQQMLTRQQTKSPSRLTRSARSARSARSTRSLH